MTAHLELLPACSPARLPASPCPTASALPCPTACTARLPPTPPPTPNPPTHPSPRSFVSYLGPFNKEFRELLLSRDFYASCVQLGIPVTKDLQVGGTGGTVGRPEACRLFCAELRCRALCTRASVFIAWEETASVCQCVQVSVRLDRL